MMEIQLPRLEYRNGDQLCPQNGVQTITAVPFVNIDKRNEVRVEALCFDNDGGLFVSNIYESVIMKVNMQTREVVKFCEFEDKLFSPTGIKIHGGKIFVAGIDKVSNPIGKHGGIYMMDPDGTNQQPVLTGMNVDDLVFDGNGGIYFTNFIGNPYVPEGSIDYIFPDLKERKKVIKGLASPNGIALSTDEKILWFTETNRGLLHRYDLEDPTFSIVAHRFEGFYGPDSCEVDADDNLYVAMVRQGRVLVFNRLGFLIGQILTPMSQDGHQTGTTHPLVHPERPECYICAYDMTGGTGANIFYCGTYTKGKAMSL